MKKTGGGTFDPSRRGIMFAAGTNPKVPEYYLIAVNDLTESGAGKIEELCDQGVKVLLDSGIFNLTNEHKRKHGVHMDEALALAPNKIDGFEDLRRRYLALAHRLGPKLWGYIELDQGGEYNKRITRTELEAEGLAPIPVYHPLVDSWEYFDELASGYDRICFGNVVQADTETRRQLLHTLWERKRAYPHLWVHVLGLTVNEMCAAFPVDSCDSSTWINGLRYPTAPGGQGYLRRVGVIADRGMIYDRDDDNPSDHKITHGPMESQNSRDLAGKVYADEMEFINHNWRRLVADRAELLGEERLPAYVEGEQ